MKSLPGRAIRPSGDRLKEALFSSLGGSVARARVLDLYAGSGALGIEALSRGAASATFVESDRLVVKVIHENLAATGLAEKATVVEARVEDHLASAPPQIADLVLIDPPYELGLPSQVLELLLRRGFLAETSTVVVEGSVRRLPFFAPAGFAKRSERRYGDSALATFNLSGDA